MPMRTTGYAVLSPEELKARSERIWRRSRSEAASLQQIANEEGVTRQRAAQILAKLHRQVEANPPSDAQILKVCDFTDSINVAARMIGVGRSWLRTWLKERNLYAVKSRQWRERRYKGFQGDLLTDLQRVATELGRRPTIHDMDVHGYWGGDWIASVFGTYRAALTAAGLDHLSHDTEPV